MPELPQAILFDLDDTIIDFSGSVDSAWTAVCADAAAETPGLSATSLFASIIRTREWFWADEDRAREARQDIRDASRRVVLEALSTLGFDLPDLARHMAETYRDLRDESLRLFPNATQTVDIVRQLGVKTALVTNGSSREQRGKIERFDLAGYFDHILIEGEFGVGKPDPSTYRHVLDALGVHAEEAWMVGDNLVFDVRGPQAVGIFAIWHDFAQAGLPNDSAIQPDRTIHTLSELI